jgi:hypothetical protein
MTKFAHLLTATFALCSSGVAFGVVLAGSSGLTSYELQSRGGTAKFCQCTAVSCISLNPGADSKGGPSCAASGNACTACLSATNNEDMFTPIFNCNVTTCSGANKQTTGTTKDCTGTIGTGTCAVAGGLNPPFPYVCGRLVNTNEDCLTNTSAYQTISQ